MNFKIRILFFNYFIIISRHAHKKKSTSSALRVVLAYTRIEIIHTHIANLFTEFIIVRKLKTREQFA